MKSTLSLFAASFIAAAICGGTGWAHGPVSERIAELEKEIEKSPEDSALYFRLAEAHREHADLPAVLASLDRVDQLTPGKFPTDLTRGSAYVDASEPQKAREALDRYLTLYPKNVHGLTLRARALQMLGSKEASLEDYRKALELSAEPEPDLYRDAAAAAAAAEHPEEAEKILAAGLGRLGPIASLMLPAVDVDVSLRHFDAALSRIDAVAKDSPRPEPWLAKRASVLAQAGRIADSRAAWESLLGRIQGLPDAERDSIAMNHLATQARYALSALKQASPNLPTNTPHQP